MTTDRAAAIAQIADIMETRFKDVIAANAGIPFPDTKVHVPRATFEGYAASIVDVLEQAAQLADVVGKPVDASIETPPGG
jgi:hypothetical protein